MNTIKKILIVVGAILALVVVVQIVNAAKYRMIVNVIEGENIMGVNPTAEKLDFGDLSRNNGMTRYVTLQSGGGISTFVTVWKFGGASDLVKVDRNLFTLKPGEEVKLSFEMYIPPSASVQKYSGWVWIFMIPKPW